MASTQSSDAFLVKQYMSGDESALSRLIELHQSQIYSFIYSKVGDRDLANDIFQDTFIKVINKLKQKCYNEEGKFLSWVMRIAHNLVIDHFRASKKMQFNRDSEEHSVFKNTVDGSPTIEKMMISLQIESDLRELIKELPADQKEVLIMRIYNDMSFNEIAEQTGVSINTALGRMRYALMNLRKIIHKNQIILTN
jgi:RNA polymerase sigma-70 factor (ECF subfamily)